MFLTSEFTLGGSEPLPIATPEMLHAVAERLFDSSFIVKPSAAVAREIVERLRALPLDSQRLWVDLLKLRMVDPRWEPCASCGGSAELRIEMSHPGGVVCARCGVQGFPLARVLTDASITSVRSAQYKGVRKGDDCLRTFLWSFTPVFRVADTVTAIDPWAVTDAVRAGSGDSGLGRAIRLASTLGVRSFTVICSSGMSLKGNVLAPADVPGLLASLIQGVALNGMAVDVVVLSKARAAADMHDRWLGTSWAGGGQLSWSLGKGLGQYNGSVFKKHHSCSREADDFVATSASELRAVAEVQTQVA